jgi:hypothetical protein
MWVPLPAQWSEHHKAEAITTRNKFGQWSNMKRHCPDRQQMPMPGGMRDGALDSNQRGESTMPNRPHRVRARTESRCGNRRRQGFDRTNDMKTQKKARAKAKEAMLRGMYDASKQGSDEESWVRQEMTKRLQYKKAKFVPLKVPRRLRPVPVVKKDDGEHGDDEREEPARRSWRR